MSNFLTPVDIGNRACQQCGVNRISDFTEDSLQAGEIGFCYDKLRQAELRRNVWRFAVRKAAIRPVDATTKFLKPTLWASTTTYAWGAIVSDTAGYLWQSRAQDNLNNSPGNSTQWEAYCGPLTVQPYDTTNTTGYFAGELVYETPGDGTYKVYLSLTSDNSVDPSTSSSWDATVTYTKDQIVKVSSTYYVSLIDFNLNQNPASAPALWAAGTTYALGNSVGGSDGTIYTSIAGGNVGHDPVLTSGFWTNTGVLNPWTTVNPFGTAGNTWAQIAVALQDLPILYPLSSAPSMQAPARNVFRLPANYLRQAPQDPKAGSISFLGAPTGLMYTDWNFEGDYITSRSSFPIVLRFVADIIDVRSMDPMFCEGLAARIASEIVERLTQSTSKRGGILATYSKTMGEARMVNGIETGPTESPEDDYVTCRI